MGYYDKDIYSQPQHFDLTIEAEVWGDLSYEFDAVLVFSHPERGVGFAADSGCSCPSPFEDHVSLDDITWIVSTAEFRELDAALKSVADAHDTDKVRALAKAAELYNALPRGRHERID